MWDFAEIKKIIEKLEDRLDLVHKLQYIDVRRVDILENKILEKIKYYNNIMKKG